MAGVMLVTRRSRGIGRRSAGSPGGSATTVAVNATGEAEAEKVAEDVRGQGRRAITGRADIADPAQVEAMFDRAAASSATSTPSSTTPASSTRRARSPTSGSRTSAVSSRLTSPRTSSACARPCAGWRARAAAGPGPQPHRLLHGLGARRCRRLHPLRRRQGRDRRADDRPRQGRRARASGRTARPGLIDTEIQDDTCIERRIEPFGSTVPIGRAGTADEVAEAVLWLLSEKASYVAGTIFNVSGGR